MSFIYKIENLSFSYDSKPGNKTVSDSVKKFELGPIDLEIKKGKLTSVLGRSGSGKTTLISILGLLRKHETGEIQINLEEVVDIKNLWARQKDIEQFRANHLGFALQKGELLPYLSVYENAALVSRFVNRPESEIKNSLDGLFDSFYAREKNDNLLEQVLDNKPLKVSQGQLQRAAVVRALANDPDIILADEPTGNLDLESGKEAMRIFRKIVIDNPKKSVIVVTHDVFLAAEFANEIIVIKNGLVKKIFISHDEYWLSDDERIENQHIVERITKELE